MNISDVNDSLAEMTLPGDQKKAWLRLIDTKIYNDMKEFVTEIRQFEKMMEVRFQAVEDKIQMVHDKLSNEIKVLYWVIGIAWVIMLFVIARK